MSGIGRRADRRLAAVTESEWSAVIPLSDVEQQALETAGRSLARGSSRFGEEGANAQASLIQVDRVRSGLARVRVRDAVGIVATPTLQLSVRPKIPISHLMHLLEVADVVPRVSAGRGHTAEDQNLAVLVCTWFVAAAERVLAEGLARDYRIHTGELTAVRGRLDLVATMGLLQAGRLVVIAEHEEHDFDTPLNRLVLHAARVVAAGALPDELRRRALRITKRMDGVGRYQPGDWAAAVDRRTRYYRDAADLARQVIVGTGRSLHVGSGSSWTFLLPTPGLVEAALRRIIHDVAAPRATVRKGARTLAPGVRVEPDLVLDAPSGPLAVGDVKHKVWSGQWQRSDLYQAVAFAAAYGVDEAVVVGFSRGARPPDVSFGRHHVRTVAWPADEGLGAEAARASFEHEVGAWLVATNDEGPAAAGPSQTSACRTGAYPARAPAT